MNAITDYRQVLDFVSVSQKENEQWYIFVIVNPHNRTDVVDIFLDNYDYLNDRTGNVHFFIPGFNNNIDLNGEVCPDFSFGIFPRTIPLSDINNRNVTFYRKGMLDTVNWLEKNCSSYEYNEGLDLILVKSYGQRRDAELDLEHLICIPLEEVYKRGGNVIHSMTFVRKIVAQNLSYSEAKDTIQDYLDNIIGNSQTPVINVFIAGSKELYHERNVVRSQLQQISNRTKIAFSCYTYEDFSREFMINGPQARYNEFIASDTDFVVFIVDGRIGGITFEEFRVAMSSFKKNGKPRIFTYCKDIDTENQDVLHIINEINDSHQYYCEYRDIYDFENCIYRDFINIAWELKNRNIDIKI